MWIAGKNRDDSLIHGLSEWRTVDLSWLKWLQRQPETASNRIQGEALVPSARALVHLRA